MALPYSDFHRFEVALESAVSEVVSALDEGWENVELPIGFKVFCNATSPELSIFMRVEFNRISSENEF